MSYNGWIKPMTLSKEDCFDDPPIWRNDRWLFTYENFKNLFSYTYWLPFDVLSCMFFNNWSCNYCHKGVYQFTCIVKNNFAPAGIVAFDNFVVQRMRIWNCFIVYWSSYYYFIYPFSSIRNKMETNDLWKIMLHRALSKPW